jgi:hypothetical protein
MSEVLMSSKVDNGLMFTMVGLAILVAAAHAGGAATMKGSHNRDDDRDDHDDDDHDDDHDDDDGSMDLANLRRARDYADSSISSIEAGAEVPAWASDRITRAQQHLGDASGFLADGKRRPRGR